MRLPGQNHSGGSTNPTAAGNGPRHTRCRCLESLISYSNGLNRDPNESRDLCLNSGNEISRELTFLVQSTDFI